MAAVDRRRRAGPRRAELGRVLRPIRSSRHLGHWVTLPHADHGTIVVEGCRVALSDTPAEVSSARRRSSARTPSRSCSASSATTTPASATCTPPAPWTRSSHRRRCAVTSSSTGRRRPFTGRVPSSTRHHRRAELRASFAPSTRTGETHDPHAPSDPHRRSSRRRRPRRRRHDAQPRRRPRRRRPGLARHRAADRPMDGRSRRCRTIRTGILALPAGFSYTIASRAGETDLSFGQGKTPDFHDGTAVVGADRNAPHAHPEPRADPEPVAVRRAPRRRDGVRPRRGRTPAAARCSPPTVAATAPASGSGSPAPCATAPAAPTPWGSWLTCEETFITAGATWSGGGQTGTYEKNHGYVFEVFQGRSDQQLPKPIKAFGRFEHEAIAVEPNRKRVYLTEDASGPNGLVYRWTAPRGVRLRRGHRQPAQRHRRHARGDADPASTTAASCPTSPTSPRPSSAARSR